MSHRPARGSFGDIRPPNFSAGAIDTFLRQFFGIAAELAPLQSERDQVVLVREKSGTRFILRICPPEEPPEILAFQNAALTSIARNDRLLPVPRVIVSLAGNDIEYLTSAAGRHGARLYTHLAGEPVWRTMRSAAQRSSLGRTLARLDRALAAFRSSSNGNAFLWNVEDALNLRPRLIQIPDAELRWLAAAVLDEFEESVHSRLAHLPRQIIHNDFNPKNVLVDPADPARITGIIDFGDMVRGPRVVDLAVAIARQATAENPVGQGSEITAAYNAELPLNEEEVGVLHTLVCVRLAMRIAIWGWRQALGDPRCDPTQIAAAIDLVGVFRRAGAHFVTSTYRQACGLAA